MFLIAAQAVCRLSPMSRWSFTVIAEEIGHHSDKLSRGSEYMHDRIGLTPWLSVAAEISHEHWMGSGGAANPICQFPGFNFNGLVH
jgi:hypothetical protein